MAEHERHALPSELTLSDYALTALVSLLYSISSMAVQLRGLSSIDLEGALFLTSFFQFLSAILAGDKRPQLDWKWALVTGLTPLIIFIPVAFQVNKPPHAAYWPALIIAPLLGLYLGNFLRRKRNINQDSA